MPQNFRELKDTNTNTAYVSNHALGADTYMKPNVYPPGSGVIWRISRM